MPTFLRAKPASFRSAIKLGQDSVVLLNDGYVLGKSFAPNGLIADSVDPFEDGTELATTVSDLGYGWSGGGSSTDGGGGLTLPVSDFTFHNASEATFGGIFYLNAKASNSGYETGIIRQALNTDKGAALDIFTAGNIIRPLIYPDRWTAGEDISFTFEAGNWYSIFFTVKTGQFLKVYANKLTEPTTDLNDSGTVPNSIEINTDTTTPVYLGGMAQQNFTIKPLDGIWHAFVADRRAWNQEEIQSFQNTVNALSGQRNQFFNNVFLPATTTPPSSSVPIYLYHHRHRNRAA